MLKLSLDALLTVDTIARRGSFAAAARELFRVPSTISYTVAKLEEDLGVQLFERFGPRVELTAAGAELLKEGRYLLKAAGDLERRVRRVASGWETEFTLAIDSMLCPDPLMTEIDVFCGVADQTRLRLLKEALSGTWEALLERRADLLVGAAGAVRGRRLRRCRWRPSASCSWWRPGIRWPAHANPSAKADLAAWRAVSVSDSARQLQARTVGLLFGQNTLAVPDMQTKHAFQRAGLGFGFLPQPRVHEDLAAGRLVAKAVEEPKPDETLYLAWRTGEEGAALDWWKKRLQDGAVVRRMLLPAGCGQV
ncbi:LysR family transcriptional regulator [Massilia sp. Dwa41.01b]|uniref:LysR family transcriptional regulator n=1 Tax=Massilia sp. Dwa41.01b TaxID=2709302 RepID=UPI001E4B0787|nr:LysR family transcriptional regulator [Massilia sp. Dwa41.01b]